MAKSISCTCLTPEELKARGMSDKRARLVIAAYLVFVLSNEWLEELFCPKCGSNRWCHLIKHDHVEHSVRSAPRELWEQVAHVDPVVANPTVSESKVAQHDARTSSVLMESLFMMQIKSS